MSFRSKAGFWRLPVGLVFSKKTLFAAALAVLQKT